MTWKVHLDSRLRFGSPGYRLYVMRMEYDNRMGVMFAPTLQSFEGGAFIPEDKFLMSDENPGSDVRGFLQAMSDAAWELGIKPKQIEDSRNELKAVRDHLADMRALALNGHGQA